MDENTEEEVEYVQPLSQSTVAVRNREARALELALAKVPYEQIAREVGFANASGAHTAVMRTLKRSIRADAESILDEELATLDRAQRAVYPKVLAGDLKAVNALLKLMDRRARYLGLDHADGLAERAIKLQEDQAMLFAMGIKAVLDALDLTPAQRAMEPEIVARQLALVAGAVDTTSKTVKQSPAVDEIVEKPRNIKSDRYPPV